MEKMKILDIMVDLETLGTGGNPVISQISAIPFNIETGEVFETHFNKLINPISCVKLGLKINGETVEWWMSQEESVVNKVFVKSIQKGMEITKVLIEFNDFINKLKKDLNIKDIRVFSNGILADARWLIDAYTLAGITPAWKYYEDSDVRTLVDLGKRILGFDPKKDIPFEGEKHNAIDDVKHQIKYCVAIYAKFKELTKPQEKKEKTTG